MDLKVIAIILAVQLVGFCKGISRNAHDYPVLPKDQERCLGKQLKSNQSLYICDPDELLTAHEASQLSKMIMKFQTNIDCICDDCQYNDVGITASIALAKKINVPEDKTYGETVKSMADHLRVLWSFGTCDDDILIFATPDMMYTSVGFRAKNYLDPKIIGEIDTKLSRETTNVYTRLSKALNKYLKLSVEAAKPAEARDEEDKSDPGLIIGIVVAVVAGVVLMIIIAAVCIKSNRAKKANLEQSRNNQPVQMKIKPMKSNEYEPVQTKNPDEELKKEVKVDIENDSKEKSSNKTEESKNSESEKSEKQTPPPSKPESTTKSNGKSSPPEEEPTTKPYDTPPSSKSNETPPPPKSSPPPDRKVLDSEV